MAPKAPPEAAGRRPIGFEVMNSIRNPFFVGGRRPNHPTKHMMSSRHFYLIILSGAFYLHNLFNIFVLILIFVVSINVSRRPEAAGGRLRSVESIQKASYCIKNSFSFYIINHIMYIFNANCQQDTLMQYQIVKP